MMRGKRALAILASLVLAVGVLSVGTFAAESGATAPTTEAAQPAPENPCAEGHAYEVKSTVAPTCTEDGYSEEVCSRCGDTRRVPGEKALGHDFSGEGRVTIEPTTEKDGEMVFTCTRDDCNETQTKTIPKLEKKAEDTNSGQNADQMQNNTGTVNQPAAVEQTAQTAQAAQEIQNTNLSVAGIVVTEKKGTIQAGSSKIKFKREGEGAKEEITLTFDNDTLEAKVPSDNPAPESVIAYTGTGTLKISLEGENAVTGMGSTYGIYAPEGTVRLTGEKGATLDIEVSPSYSNTIRAKQIVVDKPLGITAPENNYVYEGDNGMGGTYKTIAVPNGAGGNMAVTTATIGDPAVADDKKDAAENQDEEEKAEDQSEDEKKDETVDGNEQKNEEVQKDESADEDNQKDENEQKDENVTEDKNEKNTEDDQKQEDTEGTEAAKNDQQTEDENKTSDEPSQNAPASTRKKLGTTRRMLGAPPDENNTGNITSNITGNNTSNNGNNDTVTTTDLHIDGKEITDASGSVTAGETIKYKVSANSETGNKDIEITLNKAELTSAAEAAISYTGKGTLTIILKGENKITGRNQAIFAPYADLTIKGEKGGSLTANATNSAAIVGKTIDVESPLEITVPAENRYADITMDVGGKNEPVKNIAEGKESGNGAASVIIKVPVEYTITFEKNGGSGEMSDVPHKENAGNYKLPDCEFTAPDGQEFDQWEVNDVKYNAEDEIPVTDNITVKALWKDILYTVHFDAGVGTDDGSMPDQTVAKKDSKILLPDCTFTPPTGKVFDKWEVNDGEYAAGKTAPITSDTTIKALWKDPEKATYKVTYDANGGSGTMNPDTVVAGNKLTLPACDFTPQKGKIFDKWEVNGGQFAVGKKTPIVEDTTVKALWKDEVKTTPETTTKTYKVSFDANGGTGTMTVQTVESGKTLKLPECGFKAPSGMAFSKWGIGDKQYDAGANVTISADTTIKAIWKDPNHKHTWGEPVFEWSSDETSATATYTCKSCGEKTTVDATVGKAIEFAKGKKTEDIQLVNIAKSKMGDNTYQDKGKITTKVDPAGTKGYAFTVPTSNQNAAWVKNSKNNLGFTIKRNAYDDMTYEAFMSVSVDGKKLSNDNNSKYTTEKGSLILSFKPAYLNNLSAGEHTLKVDFVDGSVERKFTISTNSATGNGTAARTTNGTVNRTANATTNRTATGSPSTGDTSNWALWIGLIAVSAAAICGIVFVRKRGKKDKSADNS